MPEVHLSRRALFDIDDIDVYSIENWGERVAAEYLSDLFAGAARLGESQGLLQKRPDTSLRLRFYRVREHVLICDVIGERIFVLAVRNAVMDLPSRVAELEPQLMFEAELMVSQIGKRNESTGGA